MATNNDPFILALGRLTAAIRKQVGACPTLSNKILAIQHARDTLAQMERELVGMERVRAAGEVNGVEMEA